MGNVIDYSWARPGGAAIKAAGYTGVIRYLSSDKTGKTMGSTELQDLRSNALDVGFVWEDYANAALSGEAQGVKDAQAALAQANALGVPSSVALYFAVDVNTTDTADTIAYFKGVNSVIGLGRTGGYADYFILEALISAGVISFVWQTVAWSHGQVAPQAHLLQDGTQVFNGGADIDEVRQANWGQWPASGNVPAPNPTPAPTPTPVGPGGTYTVVSGDNLSAIGAKLGIDWRAIASVNGIGAPWTIYPGQVLHLPGNTPAPSPAPSVTGKYTVVSGDSLSAIGAKLGVAWQSIAAANGIGAPWTIYPGQVLNIPGGHSAPPAARTYTVVSGDNLSAIGAKVGVAWQTIAQLNNIGSPYVIYPNEVLRLA